LACSDCGQLADLVEEQGAPFAVSSSPWRARSAPLNAPRT